MAPSCSIELSGPDRRSLLHAAREALSRGVTCEDPTQPLLNDVSPILRSHGAAFVTLTSAGRLRGCIGSIEASAPLLWAVADAAHGAGFRDPRFDALRANELCTIRIEISVLSPLQALAVNNREGLFNSLRANRDGLLLREGDHKATFLPKVWEQLPDSEQFLDQLLVKAGLPANHWSGELQFFRYQTLTFGESDEAAE